MAHRRLSVVESVVRHSVPLTIRLYSLIRALLQMPSLQGSEKEGPSLARAAESQQHMCDLFCTGPATVQLMDARQ